MLRKTVYFRDQEDLDRFNALPNKAEWLHEHLNQAKPKVYINESGVYSSSDFELIKFPQSDNIKMQSNPPIEPTITDAEETA